MIECAGRTRCGRRRRNSISRKRPNCATCWRICAGRRSRCGVSPGTVCRARSIRWPMCRRWPTRCNCRRLPRGDGVLRHLEHLHDARRRLDGLVSRTACRTRTTTGAIASARSKGRTILRAWRKSLGGVIRACCSRRARRIRRRRSFRRRIRRKRCARGGQFRRRALAGSDHRRWRQRPALLRLPRTAAARPARSADHRPGEGIRRNLPARPRPAAAVAARFRRACVCSSGFATKRTGSPTPIISF